MIFHSLNYEQLQMRGHKFNLSVVAVCLFYCAMPMLHSSPVELSLEGAIRIVTHDHPAILEKKENWHATEASELPNSFLQNPSFGVTQFYGMSHLQQQVGGMNMWVVSQNH